VLRVDLIVIVVFLGVILTRRPWVSHQPGAFKGAIRTADGAVSGALDDRWNPPIIHLGGMSTYGAMRRWVGVGPVAAAGGGRSYGID
jgi:hypothetical protein